MSGSLFASPQIRSHRTPPKEVERRCGKSTPCQESIQKARARPPNTLIYPYFQIVLSLIILAFRTTEHPAAVRPPAGISRPAEQHGTPLEVHRKATLQWQGMVRVK
jgi:hypothetical protein